MSNIGMIIEERPASIGKFMVGRLLPFREKRMVGPFVFIDHMGPVTLDEEENFDVPPHPHIGLSTLTYLFEGNIMHRDSIGTEMEIAPGQVNWMTAGRGIVHSERTPDRLRGTKKILHGLQIWVALPKESEETEPSFFHAQDSGLPRWTEGPVDYKLIAGEALGHKSSVPVYSGLYLLELRSRSKSEVNLIGKLGGESAMYILEGSIESEGNAYESKRILIPKDNSLCEFTMSKDTVVCIFGGEPFPEERFIYWNFVASSRDKIENAKSMWQRQLFDKIEGETDFVPLPMQK